MTAKQKIEALIEERDHACAELEALVRHAEGGWKEAKRIAVKLQEAGVEDDGAAALALPQSRMEQLTDAVQVLQRQKALIVSNGHPRPPMCGEDERTVVLDSKEYDSARDFIARYERTYGSLGGRDLSAEARAFR